LLVLQSESLEVLVERGDAAVKGINGMIGTEFFDEARFGHLEVGTRSKNPGVFRSRRRRERERGGASRAARNCFHCAAARVNSRRSARVSLARERALSRTKSLRERLEAEAAARSVDLALGVRRRSSLTERVARVDMTSG